MMIKRKAKVHRMSTVQVQMKMTSMREPESLLRELLSICPINLRTRRLMLKAKMSMRKGTSRIF